MGQIDDLLVKAGNLSKDSLYFVIMRYLEALFPWIKFKIINVIVGALVKNRLDYLIEKAEYGTYKIIVDIVVNDQVRIYKQAIDDNLKAQSSGTSEEKKEAEDKLIEAGRNLKFISP